MSTNRTSSSPGEFSVTAIHYVKISFLSSLLFLLSGFEETEFFKALKLASSAFPNDDDCVRPEAKREVKSGSPFILNCTKPQKMYSYIFDRDKPSPANPCGS